MSLEDRFKLVPLAPTIYNRGVFYNRDHPTYHPNSVKYLDYWENEEKRAIEGFWGLDQDVNLDTYQAHLKGGWRFMTPQHYWYTNYCFIQHLPDEDSAPITIMPDIRDIDWYWFYALFKALGFSGFELDTETSCHFLLKRYYDRVVKEKEDLNLTPREQITWNKYSHEFLKEDGTYKEYVEPIEYLKRTFHKPMGRALYSNKMSNLADLEARGGGKSYRAMGCLSQYFNFFGARTFEEYLKVKKGPTICVGSALSSKSGALLKKFEFSQNELIDNFGSYTEGDSFTPGFFYKKVMGVMSSGNEKNPYRHVYKQKVGGQWKKSGTWTAIIHQSYENNPEAFVGNRSIFMIEDEFGLNSNAIKCARADNTVMKMSGVKMGVALKTGCVCKGTKVWDGKGNIRNIEDIVVGDKLQTIGGAYNISWLKPKAKKLCYRITTEGDNIIECSYDHPLMWSRLEYNKSVKGKKYKKVTYVNAENIKVGDQLLYYNRNSNVVNNYNLLWVAREDGKGSYYEDNNEDLQNEGISFKKVVKVECIGEQYVYNLTVDTTHSYITNGFVSSNTGGNFEKVQDAKEIFYNPEDYDYLRFEDHWENRAKGIGLFIPCYYVDSSFRDKNGNQDIELAFKQEMYNRKKLADGDSTQALDGYVIDHPLVPSEMFLSPEMDIFPTSLIREHIADLEMKRVFETTTSIGYLSYTDDSKNAVKWINYKDRYNKPINTYNLKKYDGYLEGSIVIYEHPEDDIPDPTYQSSLYKIAYDPVKDDGGGTSLAGIIVYKGSTIDTWNKGIEDNIVATYYGRLDKVNDIHEIAIKLAIYYNAKVLPETNVPDFVRYCKMNGRTHLLQISPYEAFTSLSLTQKKKYVYGVTVQGKHNIQGEQLIKQWLLEEVGQDEETGRKILRLHRCRDLRFLHELINYDRKKNTDAISAFQLIMFWLVQEKTIPHKPKDKEYHVSKIDQYFKSIVKNNNKIYNNKNNDALTSW